MSYKQTPFDVGFMVGTLLTTALLGGAIAFLFWVDWLGKCA